MTPHSTLRASALALPPWYLEGCGEGAVKVMENPSSRYGEDWGSDYGHYHLGYQRGDMTFTLKGIKVREGADIRLYVRKAEGGWISWSRLGPARWSIPGASGIREVLISAAAGATEPFFLDDFVVTVP